MTKPTPHQAPPDPTALSEDGVDRTLIRWMLSLTPRERLQAVQNHANAIRRVRDGRKSK
jgi:hypothetical protein